MTASIIICTRNRAESLAQTLEAFASVDVPAGLSAELLIIDNGSTDQTPDVVRKFSGAKIPARYLLETSPGLSRARNAGIAAARGELILFTDDDVAPAKDWPERMTSPLIQRECEGVVGRVELAENLRRPWMNGQHYAALAVYDWQGNGVLQLIGANMGFHRSVLERVPEFDEELGAGARGFAEETLFSWQLIEAGFRINYVPEARVMHRPDASRLKRSNWLEITRKHGISTAYILHHWRHEDLKTPRLRLCYMGLKLAARRLLQPPPPLSAEGISGWEMSYLVEIEKCRQFLSERHRPRNYSKRGLRKNGLSR